MVWLRRSQLWPLQEKSKALIYALYYSGLPLLFARGWFWCFVHTGDIISPAGLHYN